MNRFVMTALAPLALAAAAEPLAAQQDTMPAVADPPLAIASGARVRILLAISVDSQTATPRRDASETWLTARYRGVTADSLLLHPELADAPLALPLAAVQSLAVSGGMQRRTWAGARKGLLWGAIVGGAVTAVVMGAYFSSPCGAPGPSTEACQILIPVGGAVAGGGIGAALGALAAGRNEVWIQVPLPWRNPVSRERR